MISIGVVWRPDLYGAPVRSLEEFMQRVGAEHPVVTETIASGKVQCQPVWPRHHDNALTSAKKPAKTKPKPRSLPALTCSSREKSS